MSCLIRCLACLFCDVMCCECNCIIFPAPRCEYEMGSLLGGDEDMQIQIASFASGQSQGSKSGREVPYLKVSSKLSRRSKKCVIYFHGNAEDIGSVMYFLEPIVQETNVTFYSIEYPSYGKYYSLSAALISDTIKQDALDFYDFLRREGQREEQEVIVMGRSIGSGGASYLAAHRPVHSLILMSPFDSIKKVARGLMGCIGGIVKQHFDNQQGLKQYGGKLLVIHGEQDQVIKISHGKNLVTTYEQLGKFPKTASKVYPRRMTHNNFDLKRDIILPISTFLQSDIHISDQQSS